MASSHRVLYRERKSPPLPVNCLEELGWEMPQVGEDTWAGVMSTGCRCDPRQGWACPQRGALEEARGPQLVMVRKVEMEWGGLEVLTDCLLCARYCAR